MSTILNNLASVTLLFGLRKTQICFEEAAIPGVEIFIIYP